MTELSLIVKVTLVLLVSLATVRLGMRASASCRSLILASTFCVLLALPIASALLSPVAVSVPVLVTAPAASQIPALAPARLDTGTTDVPAVRQLRSGARQARVYPSPAAAFRALWLLGSIVLLAPIASTLWRTRSMRRSAQRWTDGETLVGELASNAGLSRSIDTLLRDDTRAPLTIGVLRPAIVLPFDAKSWTDSDLRRALVHEIEHIRRHDWAVHMVARVVCAIYWFHPLVWIAWHRLRLDSERACDDGVLRGEEGAAYAEQLLLLARRLSATSGVGLFMASRTDLSTRIAAVLDSSQRRNRPGLLTTVATMVAVVAVLLVLSPVQAVRASALDEGPRSRAASAALVGNLFDPFGGAVENVKLYLERVGGPESYQGRTDETGHFAFEALHAGTYRLAAPMDFVPPTTIRLDPGHMLQRDIRMEVDTLTDAFTVCADCPAEVDTYLPPDSLVAEFQRDREDSWNQPVRGPEPVGGWEFYWSRLPEYPPALKEAGLEGIVVVEGRIGTDGVVNGLRVVSDVHPALASAAMEAVQAERWEPGRVRGVAIEVPLRMTIDYILHSRHQ